MRSRALASRRLTATLLLGLLLAAATTIALSARGADQARAQGRPEVDMRTALLATNRTGLRLCVQSLAPGLDSRAAQGPVRGAITSSVATHPDFGPAGLGREPVVVDAGCPAAPTISNPRYSRRGTAGAPAAVATPSPYRLFVFVAPAERLAAAFPTATRPRLTPQEVLCRGHVCPEVTTALYLTPAELADPGALARGLTHGVGLWPVGERRYEPRPPARRHDERGRPLP